ncbi:MAG: BamA/TamA family outer membrane protein [Gemmatimonadales bacterium]
MQTSSLPRFFFFLACGASLAAPAGAQVQTTARDTLPVVRRVDIEGNQAFNDDRIKRSISTRASGCKSFFLGPFCWIGLDAFRRVERLDPRELRTDVARIRVFYFRRGYRRAVVDTTVVREAGRVDVTFQIDEGPPVIVESVEIIGLEDVPDAEAVVSELQLREGEPFSEVALSDSRERMERALRNRGYADAAILPGFFMPDDDRLKANITLRVELGSRSTIGVVDIRGAVEVDASDVRRLLTFKSGDVYSEEELVRSQRTLYSMALFDYVTIEPQPTDSDSIIDVLVQVNEAKTRAVQFGGGVSTTECLELEAGWAHRNFFGGTRKLELTGQISNMGTASLARTFPCTQAGVESDPSDVTTNPYNKVNWRLRADFQQPWFLGTENWLETGLFAERQSLPAIYARVSFGADIRFSREISRGTALIASSRIGRDSLEEGSADVLWCANFGVCSPTDIQTLSKSRTLSWLALTLAQSRTDAVLSPTRGYRLTLEGETASEFTASEWLYYRAAGEVSWFQEMSGGVLAIRLRGGMVRPLGSGLKGESIEDVGEVTHPLKRQYAGGAFTVRGYGQNLLGPKVLGLNPSLVAESDINPDGCPIVQEDLDQGVWVCELEGRDISSDDMFPRPVGGENSFVANIEFRFPLGSSRWTGVAFLDMGGVWNTGGAVSASEALAWSPGFGVRFLSPVGPLRFDIGYNTSGTERSVPVVSDPNDVLVQLIDSEGNLETFDYNPFEAPGMDEFFRRLQLHFSIGHAF